MLQHALRASLAAAAVAVSTVALQSGTSANATTIAWPTVAAGDVAVLFDFARSTGTGGITKVVPTGFTEIDNQAIITTNSYRSTISRRICDGSETGSISGQTGSTQSRKILMIYRGNVAITSVTVSTVNAFCADADPPAQVIAASGGVAPLVCLGSYCQYSSVTGQTMSPAAADTVSNTYQFVRDKIYNTSPADVTVDQSRITSAINILQSFYLQFA